MISISLQRTPGGRCLGKSTGFRGGESAFAPSRLEVLHIVRIDLQRFQDRNVVVFLLYKAVSDFAFFAAAKMRR